MVRKVTHMKNCANYSTQRSASINNSIIQSFNQSKGREKEMKIENRAINNHKNVLRDLEKDLRRQDDN